MAFKINGAPWRTWKLKQAPAANKTLSQQPALFVVVLISVPSDAHRRPRAVSLVLCAFLCLLHFSSLGLLLALLLVALHFLSREPEIVGRHPSVDAAMRSRRPAGVGGSARPTFAARSLTGVVRRWRFGLLSIAPVARHSSGSMQRRSQLSSSNPSAHDVHSTLVSQSVLEKRRRQSTAGLESERTAAAKGVSRTLHQCLSSSCRSHCVEGVFRSAPYRCSNSMSSTFPLLQAT